MKKIWRNLLVSITKNDPALAKKLRYFRIFKKKLDLNNPTDFNEKVIWLNLYWQTDTVVQCADKVRLTEYCELKGVPEISNEIYSIAEDAKDLEWDRLPERFVLKTNNAQGTNIIVPDKKKFNKEKAINRLNSWLRKDYSLVDAEIHYNKMKPLVLAEKFIESDNEIPTDYKIYCFNGKPELVSVTFGRTTESLKHNYTRLYYNLDWKRIFICKDEFEPDKSINKKKPKTFNQMIEYSKILSKDIPFVRVDFYEGQHTPILGEMTFTPSSGMANYFKDDVLNKLGEKIVLPNSKIIKK